MIGQHQMPESKKSEAACDGADIVRIANAIQYKQRCPGIHQSLAFGGRQSSLGLWFGDGDHTAMQHRPGNFRQLVRINLAVRPAELGHPGAKVAHLPRLPVFVKQSDHPVRGMLKQRTDRRKPRHSQQRSGSGCVGFLMMTNRPVRPLALFGKASMAGGCTGQNGASCSGGRLAILPAAHLSLADSKAPPACHA